MASGTEDTFFREWHRRVPGQGRSLERARSLAGRLGLPDPNRPVLTIVGSKGKGTAATYASAVLAAAGLRVGTVTSPAYRSNRERIRVDGRAISEEELSRLVDKLRGDMRRLPRRRDGYLSPSGLFLLAGALNARDADLDVLVLEAGMGGRSDEVALFPATVVGITPIFREHLGVLGTTPAEIAQEKAGVAVADTRAVVSAPQSDDVNVALAQTVREATGVGVEVETLPDTGSGLPRSLVPGGLTRISAEIGYLAALRMLTACAVDAPDTERLRATLASISLPGRLSWHGVPGSAAMLLADSAIDRSGFAVALTTARAHWHTIDHAVVCLPDHKDMEGAIIELGDLPVTFVRLPHDHLHFTRPLPEAWNVIDAADLTPALLAGLGDRVVALGTVYFIGRLLDLVEADTERLFAPSGH
ncbi:hypothetical protein ACFY4C_15205 [Actinomadura viridis]|uniref:hypothetical protein n=1 Tax=Actinomadura viridis TaxID=58110 RepID=UPI0036BE8737